VVCSALPEPSDSLIADVQHLGTTQQSAEPVSGIRKSAVIGQILPLNSYGRNSGTAAMTIRLGTPLSSRELPPATDIVLSDGLDQPLKIPAFASVNIFVQDGFAQDAITEVSSKHLDL
jgi:hypothetical protein